VTASNTDLKDFVTGTYGTMYYVRDMEKSTAYYQDVLGLEPNFKSSDWTTFKLGESVLALHLTTGEVSGNGILIMNSKNLKATVPTLKSKGVEFVKDYHAVCDGGYAIDIRDPNGNVVSFFEYTGS
jgi:catechol 2,3-dioxygenase-like lactoylglutathione lyase family enzyme